MRMTLDEIHEEVKNRIIDNQSLMIGEPVVQQESWYDGQSAYHLLVGAYFTTQFNFIVSVINKTKNVGTLHFIPGSFDASRTIGTACKMVNDLFDETTFRHKRRIIMDCGKLIAYCMKQIDGNDLSYEDAEELELRTNYDRYEMLTDVDWIEEKMLQI